MVNIKRPPLEVADVFREYEAEYIQKYSPPIDHLKVISAIVSCRTSALGGHVERCSQGCGYETIAYNSCRNRHCPKCQFSKAADWIDARKSELLSVPYFHVVFTLPALDLLPIILLNKSLVYNLMFQCASETLMSLAQDPKWLGAKIGAICVLHTWTQKLAFHPHIHCIVPAGGFSPNLDRWISLRNPDFFAPFAVLAELFQLKFLAYLKQLNQQKKLLFFPSDHLLHDQKAFNRFCQPLYDKKWIAYAKPSFNGPNTVVQYLGQYIHKIAISNWRLLKLENDRVFFTYRDRANGNIKKTTSLFVLDFMKMFLQHVLPSHFVKIRAYGFLSNRSKQNSLVLARSFLSTIKSLKPLPLPSAHFFQPKQKLCPVCRIGALIKGHLIAKVPHNARSP